MAAKDDREDIERTKLHCPTAGVPSPSGRRTLKIAEEKTGAKKG